MHRPWVPILGILILVAAGLLGCSPRVSRHVAESRAALEAARAAGAPARAPEQFQAAERALKDSEALVAAGDAASLLEADYRAAVATATAKSAVDTTKLSSDLERVQGEAQAARQEAGRARAEMDRLQPQVRTAEDTARAAQARAERAEAQVADLKRQVEASAAWAAPMTAYPRYVVKRGDTLPKIAAKVEVYGNADQWRRIYDANRDIIGKDRKLKVGQVLVIPKP